VKKVKYSVTPEEAKTLIDFGSSKPNLADQIGAGSSMIRNDISSNVAQYATSVTTSNQVNKQEGGESTTIEDGGLVGTLVSQNADGTWVVDGEDGNTYDNVRVI